MHCLLGRCGGATIARWKKWVQAIRIDEAGRDKAAFTIHQKLYQLSRMSFEWCTAAGTFPHTKNFIFFSVKWQLALGNRNKIVVISKIAWGNFVHACRVLRLLRDANITLILKDWCFFAKNVDYLGHVIHQKRLEKASHTASAICKLQPLASLTDLRFFPRLCKTVWRFVPRLVSTMVLLNNRLQKHQTAGNLFVSYAK